MSSASVRQTMEQPFVLSHPSRDVRWSLGFIGLLLYLIVQYDSLPSVYPVLSPLHLGKLAVGIAFLGFLIAPRTQTERSSAVNTLDAAVILFFFSALFSTALAGEYGPVWTAYWTAVKCGFVYLVVSRLLTSRWRMQVFLVLFLLLNLKLAQHAIRMYVSARGAGYSGMEIIKLGGASAGSTAYFGDANDFGLAMCVVWGLTWALFFRKQQRIVQRLFLAVCFAAFLLAILLCGSRGAVVGATAVVLAASLRTPKRARALLLWVFFTCSILFIMPGAVVQRFQRAIHGNSQDTLSRLMLWKGGISMWAHHPLFGVGPGNFGYVWVSNLRDITLFPGANAIWVPHSVYVQALANLGLAGFLCLLAMVTAFFYLNAKTRKEALKRNPLGRGSFEYCLAAGLDLAMVGYLICAAFLADLFYPHLWILAGLSVATYRLCLRHPGTPVPARPSSLQTVQNNRVPVATVM